jgi:flagellar L-ring protein precursor FlgH
LRKNAKWEHFKGETMNNRTVSALVLTVFLLALAACSQAGSIWAKRDKNMRDLYADNKARHIGDILTITITENSTVDNKAKRNLSKTTDRSVSFDGDIDFDHHRLDSLLPEPLLPSFNIDAESSNTLDSKADYKDERKFIDSITVVIVDIMPNGNLVVMGSRSRSIAGDRQVIEVSGIVRPSDIAYDNTVKSERVADFCLVTRNAGISASFNKPGWLGRIFDILWPF